ncbi:MAG: cytidine deaminase [Firmicutes bacterium]|nr:cytidine deaminase [Bacillota bacterium]
MTNKELFLEAKRAMENAYTPFSHFNVGAALLTEDGKVYTGCNVENSTLGATVCAERTASVKAVSEGSRDFKKIAVVCHAGEVTPCGICRQFLYEFGPSMTVVFGPDEDNLKELNIKELLPLGFRLENDKHTIGE